MKEKKLLTYTDMEKSKPVFNNELSQKKWAILSALMSKKGHLLKARQIQYYINHGSYGLNKRENGDGSKIITHLRGLKDKDYIDSEERCRGDNWFLTEEGKEFIKNWFERLTFLSQEQKNLVKEILLVLEMRGRTTTVPIKELKNILTSKRGNPSSPKEPLDLPSKDKFKRIIFWLNLKNLIGLEILETDEVLLKITWKGKAISQTFKEEEE